MGTVLAFGCFDILHYGHLQFFRQARKLGDGLVVVVARDSTMRRVKGREPVFDEKARLAMVRALRDVDKAILGNEAGKGKGKYDVIRKVKPSVIALGYDQPEDEGSLAAWLSENGLGGVRIARIRHVENEEVYKSSKAISRLTRCITEEL